MNKMAINNKALENYQPTPNMFYDIKGKVKDIDGKDVVIEKTQDDLIVNWTIRLKEEMDMKIGEEKTIDKENIHSVVKEVREKATDEETKGTAKILRELGLEYSEENVRMIDELVSLGIKPAKSNIDSYKMTKESLEKIAENSEPENIIKLMNRDVNFEESSLQEIAEALEEFSSLEEPFSLKKLIKIEEDMDYKDAEIVSEEIYGRKMGKDVYDIIIALDKENIDINKENIENALDVLSKIHDVRELDDEVYVQIVYEELDFSINNLYRLKNNYKTSNIEKSELTSNFEEWTILEEVNLESLKEVLSNLDIEVTEESISIGREFLLSDMNIDYDKYNKVIEMKESLDELKTILKTNNIVEFQRLEVDILNEDIIEIVEVIKDRVDEEKNPRAIDLDLGELEDISKIEDKDLLRLIRGGKDFTITNLREVVKTDLKDDLSLDYKVVDMTESLSRIFNRLGPDLKNETISLAIQRDGEPSLNSLYESEIKISEENLDIESLDIQKEDLILREYIKARNNITTNIVREGIKDGLNMEFMPIGELNNYVNKKIDRYREVNNLGNEIKNINKNKERLIPIIMKNELSMTLKDMKELNDYWTGEAGITKAIEEAIEKGNKEYKGQYREDIDSLRKEISENVKNGEKISKESYNEILNLLDQGDMDSRDNQSSRNQDEFIKIQEKISKKDLIFQVPIELDNSYKDLNIIIPDMSKSMNKNHMKFAIGIETENLGMIEMNLEVVGREVFVEFNGENNALEDKVSILKDYLNDIGYELNLGVK